MSRLNKTQRRKKRLAIRVKQEAAGELHAEMLKRHLDRKAAKKISRDREKKNEGV